MKEKLSNQIQSGVWAGLWLLAAGLRVALALVNREANDRHFQDVIVPLLKNETVQPGLGTFHPKVYHATVVFIIRLLPIETVESQIICAQMVNALAGMATLYFVYRFLVRLDVPWPIQTLAFGFFGLNPGLVGISAQATNDQFVILFVVAGTLAALAYFQDRNESGDSRKVSTRFVYYFLMLLCIVLAVGTKGNGIGLPLAVGLLLLVRVIVDLWRRPLNQARNLFELSALVILTAAALAYFKVYTNHVAYFRLFNSDHLVIGRFWGRPEGIPVSSSRGIRMLKSSLLRFPLGDLFRHPLNSTPGKDGEPLTAQYRFGHMRNYWAQVYGNFSVARFHDWPPSWRNSSQAIEWLARGLLSLNLIPLLLLLAGLALIARNLVYDRTSIDSTLLAVFCVFLAAGVRYFMIFPGYQFAKFIYVAPFLIPLAYGLVSGLNLVWKYQYGPRLLTGCFGLLFLTNVTDVVWLIWDLALKNA